MLGVSLEQLVAFIPSLGVFQSSVLAQKPPQSENKEEEEGGGGGGGGRGGKLEAKRKVRDFPAEVYTFAQVRQQLQV